MEEIMKDWGYDDFIYFILIYAAFADMKISEEEENLIKFKTGDEKFHELKHMYENNTDFDNFMVLHEFKDQYIKNDVDLEKALTEIRNIFYADGEFSEGEKNVEIAVRTILGA